MTSGFWGETLEDLDLGWGCRAEAVCGLFSLYFLLLPMVSRGAPSILLSVSYLWVPVPPPSLFLASVLLPALPAWPSTHSVPRPAFWRGRDGKRAA